MSTLGEALLAAKLEPLSCCRLPAAATSGIICASIYDRSSLARKQELDRPTKLQSVLILYFLNHIIEILAVVH